MEILIPLAGIAMITAIVIAPRYFRSQERQKLQETMRAAIERGQTIPPEVVAAITSDVTPPRQTSPERDLRPTHHDPRVSGRGGRGRYVRVASSSGGECHRPERSSARARRRSGPGR